MIASGSDLASLCDRAKLSGLPSGIDGMIPYLSTNTPTLAELLPTAASCRSNLRDCGFGGGSGRWLLRLEAIEGASFPDLDPVPPFRVLGSGKPAT